MGRKKAPAADSTSQRVREKKAPPKAERVQFCIELMARGKWVTGVTGVELAAEWGLHLGTVETDAAEASRRIHELTGGNEHLRARIQATLESITDQAMRRGQLRTAVESCKVLAGVSGVEAPRKLEVGVSLDDLDEMRRAAEANACSSSTPPQPNDENEPNS